ncbi:MAG: BrnA antitoxin family protein [Methylococcales bacterium]|nr:BrnA antitoxin family protein [Methylococcales bacterium]
MKKSASNTTKLTLSADHLPPLTAKQRAELDAIAAMPDEAIDYSDAPMLTDAFWQAVSLPATEQKTQITLRIDSDVLDFFRHTGKRYQTKINAVLRAYVDAHKNV